MFPTVRAWELEEQDRRSERKESQKAALGTT